MSFVDKLTISVQSGSGGNGRVSFRREKFVPKGGPDGGDGGRGGSIMFRASRSISTFLDVSTKTTYKADNGEDGRPKKQTGKSGHDCTIEVPCGTCIYKENSTSIMAELTDDGDVFLAANGGKGGKGNMHFSTSRIQTPRKATPGRPGEKFNITLELKMIADIGLIGYPNAGKSTLLKTLTHANPKIGHYPFTTRYPNLGILRHFNQEIIVADIPGIIEGASEGVGLGNEFLRHISRTNILLFLIEPDMAMIENTTIAYENCQEEIKKYDATILEQKKIIVAVNKIDQLTPMQCDKILTLFQNNKLHLISCISRSGIEELIMSIYRVFNENKSNHH